MLNPNARKPKSQDLDTMPNPKARRQQTSMIWKNLKPENHKTMIWMPNPKARRQNNHQ